MDDREELTTERLREMRDEDPVTFWRLYVQALAEKVEALEGRLTALEGRALSEEVEEWLR